MLIGKQLLEKDTASNSIIACYTMSSRIERFWDLKSLEIKRSSKSNDDDEVSNSFTLRKSRLSHFKNLLLTALTVPEIITI